MVVDNNAQLQWYEWSEIADLINVTMKINQGVLILSAYRFFSQLLCACLSYYTPRINNTRCTLPVSMSTYICEFSKSPRDMQQQ